MSLVVWKPKEEIIVKEECEDKQNTDSKAVVISEEPVRRNGVLVGDLSMDVEM